MNQLSIGELARSRLDEEVSKNGGAASLSISADLI
jgi:hypothetical protein